MTLNLKDPRGRELLKRMAVKADVLLENYAPGVMTKNGVGWEVMSTLNPRLVYASGTGYGLDGRTATISPWTSPCRRRRA